MPDISMCEGKGCAHRVMCFRFTATPWKYQTYSDFKPNKKKGYCEYLWKHCQHCKMHLESGYREKLGGFVCDECGKFTGRK